MCELYDYDDTCSAILMQQMDSDLPDFDKDDKTVLEFFKKALGI